MPIDLDFNIRVTVNSEEEAIRMTKAVYSGYAAEIMRIGVLYGQIPVGGAAPGGVLPQQSTARQEAKQREAAIEIKRVETHAGTAVNAGVQQEPERKRPVGLAGRKRFGRT